MKVRRGVERENFVVMLGRGEERELLGVIKERTSVWAHKLCFIYIHTHKSVTVFILVKMKLVKICIHFLYPNSHFWILKKKTEYQKKKN